MLFSGSLRLLVAALFPGPWAVAYQAPVALLVAWLVLWQRMRDEQSGTPLPRIAIAIGFGGGLGFAVAGLLPIFFTAVAAAVGVWVATSVYLEREFDLDVSAAQRLTMGIWGTTWVAWLAIGVLIVTLSHL